MAWRLPSTYPTLYCGFVVQLVSAVDKILTDSASRGPSAVAERIVLCSSDVKSHVLRVAII